jgi:nitrogen fixation protein FixH
MTLVALLVLTGLAYAAGSEFKQKAGEFTVELKFDRNPSVGNNAIEVSVKDAAGKAVTDANVAVEYSMPAMPGMPPMNYKTPTTLSGDKYKANLNLSMSGAWNIAVKVSKAGKTSTAKFNLDVQ